MRAHQPASRSGTTAPSDRGTVLVLAAFIAIVASGLAFSVTALSTRHCAEGLSAERGLRAQYLAESGMALAFGELALGEDATAGSKDLPIPLAGGKYWVDSATDSLGQIIVHSTGACGEQVRCLEAAIGISVRSVFEYALFGNVDIGANGSVFVDSYSTEQGTYESQATNYNPETGLLYARANGNIASNGSLTIRGGTAAFGDLTPGPGQVPVIKGGTIYVAGSMAPIETPRSLPPVAYNPPVASAGPLTVEGTTSTVLGSGIHRFSSLMATRNSKLVLRGDVTLYVDGDIAVSGQAQLIVEAGARVTLYHAGKSLSLGGGGLVNNSRLPGSFLVFSRAEQVSIGGSSSFYGGIYAPAADVSAAGVPSIYGSLVGNSVALSGTVSFHYDEVMGKVEEGSQRQIHLKYVRPVSPDRPLETYP